MQRAQEPAHGLFVVEIFQAAIGLVGAWNIDHGQADARDDLQEQQG